MDTSGHPRRSATWKRWQAHTKCQTAVVANLWTTGAEGPGWSQSRRITKPLGDPKQPRMEENCEKNGAACASVSTH